MFFSQPSLRDRQEPAFSIAVGWFVCALLLPVADTAAQPEVLRTQLSALLDTLDSATWVQTSWERMDEQEEHTSARCLWAGQDNMRLDVFDGRGAGATAILYKGKVYGFKRGLLSVFKRSFDPEHPRVLSLRGNSLESNGFVDDLRYVIDFWDRVTVEGADGAIDELRLTYEDADGLRSTLGLRLHPIQVAWHERTDHGRLVERYMYSDVRYNLAIEPDKLRP